MTTIKKRRRKRRRNPNPTPRSQSKTQLVFQESKEDYMPKLMYHSIRALADNGGAMDNVNTALTNSVAERMERTPAQMAITIPKKRNKPFFQEKVEWSWTFLKNMNMIEMPKKGSRQLTEFGFKTARDPNALDFIKENWQKFESDKNLSSMFGTAFNETDAGGEGELSNFEVRQLFDFKGMV